MHSQLDIYSKCLTIITFINKTNICGNAFQKEYSMTSDLIHIAKQMKKPDLITFVQARNALLMRLHLSRETTHTYVGVYVNQRLYL